MALFSFDSALAKEFANPQQQRIGLTMLKTHHPHWLCFKGLGRQNNTSWICTVHPPGPSEGFIKSN